MLVQIDGSFHHWLEDRAEPLALLAAIDDATGKILAAVFLRQEDTEGYFLLIRQMIKQYGIPMSIYAVELRLRGIQTLEEANQVLPELIKEHNEKFAVAPLEPESAFVPLEPGQSLDLILCFRDQRIVGPGETISYRGKTYILDVPNSAQTIPAKTPVEVRKTLDGRLFVWYKGKPYPLKETTRDKASTSPEKKKESSEKKSYKPGPDHPWRKYRLTNSKELKPA